MSAHSNASVITGLELIYACASKAAHEYSDFYDRVRKFQALRSTGVHHVMEKNAIKTGIPGKANLGHSTQELHKSLPCSLSLSQFLMLYKKIRKPPILFNVSIWQVEKLKPQICFGVGKMAQRLRALAALPKILGVISSIHMAAHIYL